MDNNPNAAHNWTHRLMMAAFVRAVKYEAAGNTHAFGINFKDFRLMAYQYLFVTENKSVNDRFLH